MAELSIIFCVHDDIRIKDALDSVYTFCQVIVVANAATEEIRNILDHYPIGHRFKLQVIYIPEKGIALARETGANNASYDKMLFMDSDCVLLPGGIEEVSQLLDSHLLIDGRIQYKYYDFQSSITAFCRSQSVPNRAFCPGLAIRKEIKPLIGGYYFDTRLGWLEDSEINMRFRKNNIPCVATKGFVAEHDVLTFAQDLTSVFLYGSGRQKGVRRGVFDNKLDAIFHLVPSYLRKNIWAGFYLFIWNVVFLTGFLWEKWLGKDETNGEKKSNLLD